MKKKAIILNNVLGVIIAIIGLTIIMFASVKIYQHATADEETDSAKQILNSLEAKINAIPENQKVEHTIQGFISNRNWYLVGWGKNEADRPQKCFFSSCICVCTGISGDNCQEEGICRRIEFENFVVENNYAAQLEEIFGKSYDENGNHLKISQAISIPKNLLRIQLEKNSQTKSLIITNPLQ